MKKTLLYTVIFTMLCTLLLSAFSIPVIAASEKNTTPSGIELDMLEVEIDRFVEEYIGVTTPGAAVAVIKNGEIIFSGTYGLADIENNTPVDINTVFEYGSISKLFTWVSVMQLHEQGKLDLDADVRIYLPDEFNQKWKMPYTITMRNIMNHSAGFGEYPFDLILSEKFSDVNLADEILKLKPSQYFEPGTGSVYSNYATALAGYIVECITGQAFYQYQKENIFDPLGMHQTAGHPNWEDSIRILDEKAQGYRGDGKGNFKNTGWSYVAQYPAGSINGTAADLAKFLAAFMPDNGKDSPFFQNPDTLSEMLSPSYAQGADGTAHGLFEFDSATAPAFGHGGNTASFSCQSVFVPEEQFGLVVLTNASNEYAITYGLHDFLIGNKEVEIPASGQEFPDAHILTGSYVTMRRSEKTQLEFSSYLPPMMAQIQAIDHNRIKLQMQIFSAEYIQTSPYVFEITTSTSPILRVGFNKLTFKMENGVPVQIMVGNGLDFSAFPSHRSSNKLILDVVILIISVLFFIVFPIVLLITAFRRKKKKIVFNKKFIRSHTALTLSGTLFLLNHLVLIIALGINPMLRYTQIFLFSVVNYVICAIGIVSLILGVIYFKKQTTKTQKIWFVITGFIFVLFVLLLINWNMFMLYI